jgi:hypothetical protein
MILEISSSREHLLSTAGDVSPQLPSSVQHAVTSAIFAPIGVTQACPLQLPENACAASPVAPPTFASSAPAAAS